MRNGTIHSRGGSAFTLVELMVVVAIVGVVASLGFVVTGSIGDRARAAEELHALRQMMTAYHLYANENNGELMAGYDAEPAYNEEGESLHFPMNARYPWRLAPYLEYQLSGTLFVGDQSTVPDRGSDYAVSVAPSFGINATFVGGDYGGGSDLAPSPRVFDRFGRFCALRMTDVEAPGKLIVFGSARSASGGDVTEGYYIIKSPYFQGRRWAQTYRSSEDPERWGFVHPRHSNKAAFAFLDGHVELLNLEQMQDMRLWSPQAAEADEPEWTIQRR